jgi:hypothetical protein
VPVKHRIALLFASALAVLGVAQAALPVAASAGGGTLNLRYLAASANSSLAGQEATQISPQCADPAEAVGGGVDTSGSFGQEALTATLPGTPDMVHYNQWLSAFDDVSFVSGQYITAGVVCGALEGLKVKSQSEPSLSFRRASSKVRCPAALHAVGGGAYTTGSYGQQRVVGSAPFDSGDHGRAPDDGWRATDDNLSASSQSVLAYVVCAPIGGLHYETSAFSARGGHRGAGSAPCPKGQWVLGGGVTQNGKPGLEMLARTMYNGSTDMAWNARVDSMGTKKLRAHVTAICHK